MPACSIPILSCLRRLNGSFLAVFLTYIVVDTTILVNLNGELRFEGMRNNIDNRLIVLPLA